MQSSRKEAGKVACRTRRERGFADLHAARQWAGDFVHWYNYEHRHSGIRYVTPAQRHTGKDREVLKARQVLYERRASRYVSRPHAAFAAASAKACTTAGGKPLRPGNSGASARASGIFTHSRHIRRRSAGSGWSSNSVRECSTA